MIPVRFGTDGIRGVAGESITIELAAALGRAIGARHPGGKILIGRDTRASGVGLAAALAQGIAEAGAVSIDLGVIPTSGLAILAARDASITRAVAVTASHNPAEYNGLKVIGQSGKKIDEQEERALEVAIAEALQAGSAAGSSAAGTTFARDAIRAAATAESAAAYRACYASLLAEAAHAAVAGGGSKLHVVVDAANGAGAPFAVEALRATGATVTPFAMGDGAINDGVGATEPAALARAVVAHHADLGVALDGDADRCVAVDASGAIVDGDVLIALIALDRRERRVAGSDRVIATVLTNSGVERHLSAAGIALTRTAVGDRHIAEALDGATEGFGGEKSGHLLFAELAPTGDGLLSAIQLIALVARAGRPLAALAAAIPLDPQIQVAIRVAPGEAERLLGEPALIDAISAATPALEASGGRILVRASGTEPLLRIMAEGPRAEPVRVAVDTVKAAAEALLRGR